MSTIFESLKSYFQKTPIDRIQSDWSKFEKYDKIGPTIDCFLTETKQCCELENSFLNPSHFNQIIENPKFASDFFLYFC